MLWRQVKPETPSKIIQLSFSFRSWIEWGNFFILHSRHTGAVSRIISWGFTWMDELFMCVKLNDKFVRLPLIWIYFSFKPFLYFSAYIFSQWNQVLNENFCWKKESDISCSPQAQTTSEKNGTRRMDWWFHFCSMKNTTIKTDAFTNIDVKILPPSFLRSPLAYFLSQY